MSTLHQGHRPATRPQAQDLAQAYLTAYCAARTAAVSGKGATAGMAQANMRRQLARDGIKPAA